MIAAVYCPHVSWFTKFRVCVMLIEYHVHWCKQAAVVLVLCAFLVSWLYHVLVRKSSGKGSGALEVTRWRQFLVRVRDHWWVAVRMSFQSMLLWLAALNGCHPGARPRFRLPGDLHP